jgi:hypothetical protein
VQATVNIGNDKEIHRLFSTLASLPRCPQSD